MALLVWIVIFALLGGILSVLLAGVVLMAKDGHRERIVSPLVSFATGALLGAAFLGLLPHALASPSIDDFHDITAAVLAGILVFFLLEKFVIWRHCHSAHCEAHGAEVDHSPRPEDDGHRESSASVLILIGDSLHNFIDGVLIAAAFMTDFHLGVVTAFAVIAHEIPQELGDFVVLLNGGFSRKQALIFNILSSLTTVLGAVLAYFMLQGLEHVLPYVLAVAAASFIYVAVADLIPGLHKRVTLGASLQQIALISAGVGVIYFSHSSLH